MMDGCPFELTLNIDPGSFVGHIGQDNDQEMLKLAEGELFLEVFNIFFQISQWSLHVALNIDPRFFVMGHIGHDNEQEKLMLAGY